ncbi:MAG: hypothetical protein AAFX99_11490, partial [Myxococcota bacterium]
VTTENPLFDTILYVRSAPACTAPELPGACNDNVQPEVMGQTWSQVQFEATAGADYFIFVDGSSSDAGAYTLNLSSGPCP